MKKRISSVILLFAFNFAISQVGINTTNPQAIFHIDGGKDNPSAGVPTPTQQANDVVVTQQGRIGVGTSTPSSSLEINSFQANRSGLKFTNLTTASPLSSGATLGIDTSGNVITVPGSAFVPAYGRDVLGGTKNIAAGTANYNLMSFTLPTAGTYLVTYSIRGEIQVLGGYGYLTGFLSTAASAASVIPSTEVLIVSSFDASRQVIGGTGVGSLVLTVNGPTTYYVGIKSSQLAGIIFDNADGRTSVNYVKVTP
ncbi:hypothetical protein ACP3T3_06775 [Chryseobacterium sp. CBSDS_008]|uniref:hypothetical protein n=1 Tax=Chryseobacterium sp. CBSDS_008 TaxID=3415265 RepID=UPI003CEB21DE